MGGRIGPFWQVSTVRLPGLPVDPRPPEPVTVRSRLAPRAPVADAACMTDAPEESRFRHLPERVRPEELVETVDTAERPVRDEETEERERLLRSAGGL